MGLALGPMRQRVLEIRVQCIEKFPWVREGVAEVAHTESDVNALWQLEHRLKYVNSVVDY